MRIDKLYQKAPIPQLIENAHINNLMYMIWSSRKDLQIAFDLKTLEGQKGLVQWCNVSVLHEYGINPSDPQFSSKTSEQNALFRVAVYINSQMIRLEYWLRRFARILPKRLQILGKSIWINVLSYFHQIVANNNQMALSEQIQITKKPESGFVEDGANLIGYAHAELGMGEHVRMSAAALETTNAKFGVINFDFGTQSRKKASLDYGKIISDSKYKVNIFHINADQMLSAYCYFGHTFFSDRYNIGFWAWELAKCPNEWIPVIDLVDEIWAPSRFIQDAFSAVTNKPVEYMPLCVTLPVFEKKERKYFGLPDDDFLFLFAFDFLSYIDRKNPFAAIHAFKKAFTNRHSKAGLVIKVMNGDVRNPMWIQMLNMIGNDPRIHIINEVLDRNDVLALLNSCNCFVSLHRSEGFGRGPAEAMYLGKPVIVTNYSGNTDFTKANNSCLVDYRLVCVEPHQYPFSEGQVWADVDTDHAAWHMRRIYEDDLLAKEIGLKGMEFIHANFNQSTVGNIYSKRLNKIISN